MPDMSSRERITAALNFQAVDKIPFVPLIADYTLRDMPSEVFPNGVRNLETSGIIGASRYLDVDLMIRHIYAVKPIEVSVPHLGMMGTFDASVKPSVGFNAAGCLVETVETPVGSIEGQWKFTEKVGNIPHAVKHTVNNREELDVFLYLSEHIRDDAWIPDFETYSKYDRLIGDDGIATSSISNTPFMYLIEMVWGLENTYYLLHDYPEIVEEILHNLSCSLLRFVELIAQSPAKVIIQYENTSSTLLSPEIFNRYCLPLLNQCGQILRREGKIFLVHMCGTLQAFVDDIKGSYFQGICDIAPYPTGDLPLAEAADRLDGKIVIGGIDPNTFACTDQNKVRQEVTNIIHNIKPYRGVLLGSADSTPRGTPIDNFRIIRELVNTEGAYI